MYIFQIACENVIKIVLLVVRGLDIYFMISDVLKIYLKKKQSCKFFSDFCEGFLIRERCFIILLL